MKLKSEIFEYLQSVLIILEEEIVRLSCENYNLGRLTNALTILRKIKSESKIEAERRTM